MTPSRPALMLSSMLEQSLKGPENKTFYDELTSDFSKIVISSQNAIIAAQFAF